MKKVLILCQPDEPLKNCFDSIHAAEIVFSADAEIPQDTDCVLISQRFTGAALPELLLSCRRSSLPAAVFTDDASEQNQELLLDMGFDHILLLPMSAKLLDKQITALLGSASASEIGFALFAQLEESDAKTGAFQVSSHDFPMICRFVERLQGRMEKPSQLVIFHFSTRLKTPPEPGTVEQTFPIVQTCLRRGDIVCMDGQQILAILVGADEAGGRTAAERIIATYQAHCCDSIYDLHYNMQPVGTAR